MRLFVLARHGQSELNVTHRVNGDPAVPRAADPAGRGRGGGARASQLAGVRRSTSACTPASGARAQTAEIALAGRTVPLEVEPLLDDIYVGELEGQTIDDYRAWKRAHTRARRVPGRREPRRRPHAATRRATSACSHARAADPRRLPRDPRPLRGQRRRGLGRARRPRARDRQLRPPPLRRGRARARRRADPPLSGRCPIRPPPACSRAWVFQTPLSPLCM